tara:strand:+ start:2502 stop:2870 length:369 start_codon:yes stop_codon:yes gene_type:complete
MELNQVLKINKHATGKEMDINMFLSEEGNYHKKEGWNKLSRTMKLKLLNTYADNYGKKDKLTNDDIKKLKIFLRNNLLTTKLLKVKDVIYNKEEQKIEQITPLSFVNNKFLLSRNKSKKNKN